MTENQDTVFRRLDDLPCVEWRPLTTNECRMLAPIGLTDGDVLVNRLLLALLLGERDRLRLVCESARWVADCAAQALEGRSGGCDPLDLQRSTVLLQHALSTLDGDSQDEPPASDNGSSHNFLIPKLDDIVVVSPL